MHIKARLLVVSVFDIGTRKTQKLCFLKPHAGRSLALNSQKVDSYFILPMVSHVGTPGFLWAKTVHQSEELWFFVVGASPLRTAVLFLRTKEAWSLSCLPCR